MIDRFLDLPTLAVIGGVLLLVLAIRYPNALLFSSPADRNIKQVRGLPLIGNTFEVVRSSGRLLDLFLKWQRTYGEGGKPFTATLMPFGRAYMINRPGYIAHIQKKNFEKYPKGIYFRQLFSDLLGEHGIFVADGNIWKEERKTASVVFSAGSFRTHVTKALHTELDILKQLYSNLAESGKAVKLQDIHFRFTLATFGIFAFDDDFGQCLHPDPARLQQRVEFAHAFDYAQKMVDSRLTNPFWRLTEAVTPSGWKMAVATRCIHQYAYQLIDQRQADFKEKGGRGVEGKAEKEKMNLLQLFMGMTDNRDVLMETVLNFIIAGRDTTAQALSWWFWYLIGRPDIVAKIRDEVQRVLGPDGRVDYDNMKDLVYTTACFYETLRLHPSVPKNMKFVAEDDIISGDPDEGLPDIHVKKGDSVIFSDWVMGRMPEVWGQDAECYNPSRFLDASGTKLLKESQFKFHAFNAGPRLCLGQQLATYEAISVVAEVLRDFDVEDVVERTGRCGMGLEAQEQGRVERPPPYQNSLTLPIMTPYAVRFRKRQQEQ